MTEPMTPEAAEPIEFHTVNAERLARARHRWQHPTFALDLTLPPPGLSKRCGCYGWASTVIDMLQPPPDGRSRRPPGVLPMTPEAASRDRREPWEPLSANELRDLREQPVVNRNGSTGNLVDRLIATVDLAWAEIGHLRLAASQPSPSAVPEALRLCVYCNTDQFACREWNRVEKVCCPDCTHNDAALPPSAPEDIEVLIERLCSEALGHIAKAASSKAWKRGAESAVEWFRMALTQVLASSPVAPTEGLARELADAAQAFLDWEVAGHMGMGHPAVPERTRLRNALAALATPGIAALPALDEKRLARAWTTHYGSHPNLDCGPFCADDLAAEYLATTTEETTDG